MPNDTNQEQAIEIRTGMSLEVLTQENQVIFLARVEEIRNGAVKLVNASGGAVPQVFYNTEIKLRRVLSNAQTVLLQGVVRGNSERFWLIEDLTGQVRVGRSFFRQEVSVKARVSCIKSSSGPRKSREVPCELLDISGGGVRIGSAEQYQSGDLLLVAGASFAPVKGEFSFCCRVLRVEQRRKQYIYGCQFEGMTQKEQDRLIETIFVLQRQSAQHKLGRGAR